MKFKFQGIIEYVWNKEFSENGDSEAHVREEVPISKNRISSDWTIVTSHRNNESSYSFCTQQGRNCHKDLAVLKVKGE